MGRKRKGVGATTGSRPKVAKVPKRTEDTDETGILAIKIAAKTAIKRRYHKMIIPWLEKQSIKSTTISEAYMGEGGYFFPGVNYFLRFCYDSCKKWQCYLSKRYFLF